MLYVNHTDAIKTDVREIELLVTFNCWISWWHMSISCLFFWPVAPFVLGLFLGGQLIIYLLFTMQSCHLNKYFSHTFFSSFRFKIKTSVTILSRLLYAEVSCVCLYLPSRIRRSIKIPSKCKRMFPIVIEFLQQPVSHSKLRINYSNTLTKFKCMPDLQVQYVNIFQLVLS